MDPGMDTPITLICALILALACGCAADTTLPPALGAPCECPGDDYPCDLAGCGDGASCRGGTCAIGCTSSDDCPDGAICQPDGSTTGGSCAYACETAADCPADLKLDRCDGTCYGGPLVTR